MAHKFQYAIVGAGIAGTSLALAMLEAHIDFVLIDSTEYIKASAVAAGLYNPIVFKRLVPSWNVEILLPTLDDFYSRYERIFSIKFHHKMPIMRVFPDENEISLWKKKANDPNIAQWINPDAPLKNINDAIKSEFGFGEVLKSGFVDVNLYLNSAKSYLKSLGRFLDYKIDYNSIKIGTNEIDLSISQAENVVFAEGWRAINNPYFPNLPFKLTKGETLTIALPKESLISNVYTRGCFVLPNTNQTARVGATYEWNDLNEETTSEASTELISKASVFVDSEFEVISHQAGIRPTVIDRRPLLGKSIIHSNIYIFNGLGTKGVMIAPYYARHFVQYLSGETDLDSEVNISRFEKKK